MGNKNNKTIRRYCVRKRRNKNKRNILSQLPKNRQTVNFSTRLTLLTTVDPTAIDNIGTVEEHNSHMDFQSADPSTPIALPTTVDPTAINNIETVEEQNSHMDFQRADPSTLMALPTTVDPTAINNETVEEQNRETNDIELLVENQSEKESFLPIEGRRVVDIMYFVKELQNISSHSSLFNCNLKDMSLIGENRNGLISKYKFRCHMCNTNFFITNEDTASKQNIDVNLAAVTGVTSAGIGYSQFKELTACVDIPIFTSKSYLKIQDVVYEKWEATAVECMEKAAMRERNAAISEGKLSKDGIPMIDVYADGVWSSRSYGNNYKALSGAAAIVGRKFGEVLFIGIKNKYCLVCARADKKQITAPKHKCYKNYSGASSGMESEIICQGFDTSLSMYNIIYGRLIADGDSATYAKILARNPYPNHTVQKIECRNHLLRNLCNRLRTIQKETKYPLEYRKLLSEVKIMTIRKVVIASILKYKSEKEKPDTLSEFRNEVQNSIYHAFGNHRNCKNYYCSKDKTIQSNIEIENTSFWMRIQTIVQSTLSKSRSLLEDVDTNAVERFNSVVAKIVGGKRINFSLRRGYRARCSAAVLFFNNHHPRYTLHKKILGRSPKSHLKKFEEQRLIKRKRNLANPHKKNRVHNQQTVQHDYGAQSSAPDMEPEELIKAKESFLRNLQQLTLDKDAIQKGTSHQRDSMEWLELRKNMITASNFGMVVKRRENSSKAKLVQNILYKSNLSNVTAVAHGIENEQLALQQLALQENVKIEPCGLFVDQEYPFIGATPDGLIGEDTIIEIKCPIVAFKIGIENAIKQNKVQMWKYDKKKDMITINKTCNWYYQIQGQLHVTQKNNCLFAVWSGEKTPLKTLMVHKDDAFWETKMKEKIITFYMEWLLPEIVDSRQARGMPLRDTLTKSSRRPAEEQKGLKRRSIHERSISSPSEDKENFLQSPDRKKRQFNKSPNYSLPCCSRQLTFDEM